MCDATDLFDDIRAVIASLATSDVASLAPDTALSTIGFDSLSTVELMVNLEDRFAIRFLESEIAGHNFGSLAAISLIVTAGLQRADGHAPQ